MGDRLARAREPKREGQDAPRGGIDDTSRLLNGHPGVGRDSDTELNALSITEQRGQVASGDVHGTYANFRLVDLEK